MTQQKTLEKDRKVEEVSKMDNNRKVSKQELKLGLPYHLVFFRSVRIE